MANSTFSSISRHRKPLALITVREVLRIFSSVGITGPFYPLDEAPESMPYSSAASTQDAESSSDIWSNSALFRMHNPSDWAKVYEANTIAPFFMTMGFLDLVKAGAGADTSSVINIWSAAGTSDCKVMFCIVG